MKLSFRLGSIPVRIHASFLLVVALLGASGSIRGVAVWVALALVGVLLHELGHALVGMAFGLAPQIDLIGFGGLTSWTGGDIRGMRAAKRIAISLAGPFVGIAIGLGLKVLRIWQVQHGGLTPQADELIQTAVFVTLNWGVFNLLPVLPLDGGNVLFQVLQTVTKGRGEVPARVVSIVVAAGVGIATAAVLRQEGVYIVLLAAMFAMQNVNALRARGAQDRDGPLRDVVRGGFEALNRGETAAAVRAAHQVLGTASQAAVQIDAVRLLAFAHLESGAWGPLLDLMESRASAAINDDEMAKFAEAAREYGRPDEAARISAVLLRRRTPAGATAV